jgi:hypothetical protein
VKKDTSLSTFLTPLDAIERSSGVEFFPNLVKSEGGVKLGELCKVAKCDTMLAFKFRAKELSKGEE